MKTYNVSIEGIYGMVEGKEQTPPQFLGKVKAKSFKCACKKVIKDLGWDKKFYNERRNSFWGSKFIEGEV